MCTKLPQFSNDFAQQRSWSSLFSVLVTHAGWKDSLPSAESKTQAAQPAFQLSRKCTRSQEQTLRNECALFGNAQVLEICKSRAPHVMLCHF
eukprot:5171735-Amphidinium_carterae.2